VKLLTRRRKRTSAFADGNGSYDAAAVVPAIAEGRWRVPDRFNFTRDVVEVIARDPKRRALTFTGKDGVIEPRSFLLLAEGAARWASVMRENGVTPGDRVLVLVGKTPDWLEVMLAAIKVGAVSVPSPETMSAASLGIRISGSGAKLVVAPEASRDELERIAEGPAVLYVEEVRKLAASLPTEAATHDTGARDPAFILTTAGAATGPRGVTHTHGAAFAARLQAEHWLDAGPHDAVWCTADASSGAAVWNVLLGPWSRGAEIVLHQGQFEPAERLDLIRRLDATVLCQTPGEYKALLSAARDIRRHRPPKLRRLVSTGDHLSPDLIAAYEEAWGLTICDGYGQVETGIVAANGAGPGFRNGSIGLPLPGYEVAVVDDQGDELEAGVEGDLAVRGRPPSLFAGYWESPDETKAAFRGDWYVTGDVAACDEDGFLWFLGRVGDVISSGGRRFGPIEVEEALAHHDAVADAVIVGARDLQRGGQYVRAFVVLKPDVEASDRLVAEIREHARQSVPGHKVPREIEFVDAVPTTADGKVKRLELRERPVVGLGPLWPPSPAPALASEPPRAPEPEAHSVGALEAVAAPEPPVEPAVEVPPLFEQPVELAVFEAQPEPEQPYAEPELAFEPIAEPEPELEPVAEVVVEHEPELEPVPEPEPIVEQVARVEPMFEPLRPPEPEPEPEPEPVAETVFEPSYLPELVAEPEPEPEPELVAEPEPVAEVIPLVEPAPDPEPEDLPDYIVVPGSEQSQDGAGDESPGTDPGLGFMPITELIFASETEKPAEESESKPKRERRATERRAGKDRRRRSSSHEPGDENDETGWMQGLSNRLSAYSLAEDGSEPAENEDEQTSDG
jgi:acyl-coenzyme A synthetase/AMP-(fatty) acid ligase